ncbi:eCIS core domain-containing protein [Kitasatospora sp. NPDC004240]
MSGTERGGGAGTARTPASYAAAGLAGRGRPLEAGVRDQLSARFGHDFGPVRVHTGPEADAATRALDAKAYAVGHDVVFSQGSYDPLTASGRSLIAHELAHVAQHGGRAHAPNFLTRGGRGADGTHGVRGPLPAASAALERQADLAAALSGGPLPAGWAWQRATEPFLGRAETTWQPFDIEYAGGPVTVEKVRQLPEDPSVVLVELGEFVLPREKGPWLKEYEALARLNAKGGGALQAVTDVGGKRIRTELWQKRAPSDELRQLWLQRVKWPAEMAGKWWHEAGGKAQPPGEFKPYSTGDRTEIDHVLELQLGGTNVPDNLAPHDSKENRASGLLIWQNVRAAADRVVKALDEQHPEVDVRSLTLRFSRVRQTGAYPVAEPTPLPQDPDGRAAVIKKRQAETKTSVQVHLNAMADLAAGARPSPADLAEREKGLGQRVDYPIRAGAATFTLRVRPDIRGRDPIEGDELNHPARELIPAMALRSLRRTANRQGDEVAGSFTGTRSGTRTPLAVSGSGDVVLNVVDPGPKARLRFAQRSRQLQFTYPYLSPGFLDLEMGEQGLVGKGRISPTVPLLSRVPIEVTLDQDGLRAAVTPDRKALSLPPFTVTEASLGISLNPDLKASGRLGFELGRIVTGTLDAGADTSGLFATGTLNAVVPGLERAQADVSYRPGTGLSGRLDLTATPRAGLVQGGSVVVAFTGSRWDASGTVDLLVLGNAIALTVERRENRLRYAGEGRVTVPGLRPVDLRLAYDGERVTGSGQTTFTILGLNGDMTLAYRDGRFTGEGTIALKRDRIAGQLTAVLDEQGRISGRGQAQVEIRPGLVGTVGVVLSPERRLRVEGELRFPPYVFLKPSSGRYPIFDIPFPEIPIFAVPLGPTSVGLVAQLSAAAAFRYGFGPGTLHDLVISAGFDPLEADTDLKVAARARLSLPAEAGLELSLRAAAGLSVGVGSVTAGIRVTGGVLLRGGLDAQAALVYEKRVLSFDANAEIKVQPVLTLAIAADIVAAARLIGEKRWEYALASYAYSTGLEFGLSAPFHYRSDQELRPPEAKDIKWITPQIDVLALADRITDRVRTGLGL